MPNVVEEVAKTEKEYNSVLKDKKFDDNSWLEYIEKYSQSQRDDIATEIEEYKEN